MLKNYIKIAFRNLKRYKGYSLINIAGLATGIACCLLILLLVRDDLRFDRFHEHKSQIYRVIVQEPGRFYMGLDYFAVTPAPLASALKEEYPEVIAATKIYQSNDVIMSTKDKRFYEDGFLWADDRFFDIFTFPFLRGDPSKALSEPYSMVISERMAHKYFGDEDPIGKIMALSNRYDFTVAGIMKDIPQNSHLRFDFLASLMTLKSIRGQEDYLEDGGTMPITRISSFRKVIHPKIWRINYRDLLRNTWETGCAG
jgi:putative ABC transport system permease protein